MNIATLALTGYVWWKLTPADPAEAVIPFPFNARLVNPLVFSEGAEGPQIIPINATTCVALTNRMIFRLDDGHESRDQLEDRALPFLRLLRLLSKQAAMPTDYFAIGSASIQELPAFQHPGAPKGRGKFMGTYRVRTALSFALVAHLNQTGLEPAIPICHEILLDALRAAETRNNREAILYSAIAIESLARTVLESEHQRIVGMDPAPAHTNVLEFPQAGGGIVRKDPVYTILADADSFSRLLHELPLYLIRRSLLQDNQVLYRDAIALYRTRNRLSHGQPVEAGEGTLLTVDQPGAMEAVTIATKVFEWFGFGGYLVPVLDSVPFAEVVV